MKATDRARTNEVKFYNTWLTCDIVMPKFVKILVSQGVQLLSNFTSTIPILSMAFTYDSRHEKTDLKVFVVIIQ